MTQIRSVVVYTDGREHRTGWYAETDPAAMDALRDLLWHNPARGYVVWWERREHERAPLTDAAAAGA